MTVAPPPRPARAPAAASRPPPATRTCSSRRAHAARTGRWSATTEAGTSTFADAWSRSVWWSSW